MRPYLNVSSDAGFSPNLRLTTEEADCWRATDLRESLRTEWLPR